MTLHGMKTSLPLRVGLSLFCTLVCWLTLGRACWTAFASIRLAEAAREGRTGEVVVWIGRGANLNAQDRFGDTPLMYAARNAHPETVHVLLAQGADYQCRDRFGLTAANWATFHLRESRTFHHPDGMEIRQVPRPDAQQTVALLSAAH